MGQTNAVAFTNAWAARARQLGAIVDFEAGWDTRGNGSAANYEGAIVHHTASPSSQARPFPTRSVLINGRPDLKGPLCNVAGPWCPPDAPRLVVISARPANHAGASGGRSMGPLPVTSSFNARVFGLEIDYAGLTPMAPGQYRAALIFARAVADVLGRTTEYVRAHAETSVTGKWDPGYANGKTIDMAAFRRDAANLGTTYDLEDNVSVKDVVDSWYGPRFRDNLNFAQVVHDIQNQVTSANAQIAGLSAAVDRLAAAVGGDDLTADELKAAVREAISDSLVKVQVSVDGPTAA